ncbi:MULTISPECIES: signal peptidase II [Gemella]|uniref:signal peptidase II n=1 Tax=Gemella TaxID=1378 RepID=UPI000767E088|nr:MULTISPECIES: signal peptidase II [Gemella]AME09524.1 signal peptidase II [Gemella sp. oral taxon 928]AXI27162.1 lipoprotein signal peptidase [Gemella sp. ND 6198]
MVYIIIFSIIFIFLDQLSKYFILNDMNLGDSKEIITNFFNITSHRNRGAAWGILQDSRYFFIVTTLIFLIILFYYIYKQREKITKFDILTFSLIVGGAIGNFIDRIIRHEVVDFLDFELFGYNFPIFNLADTFICVGVLFLLVKIYKEEN